MSNIGFEGVIAPALSAELTVTESVADAEPPRESVTLTQYVVKELGEAEYVGEIAPPIVLVHPELEYHW